MNDPHISLTSLLEITRKNRKEVRGSQSKEPQVQLSRSPTNRSRLTVLGLCLPTNYVPWCSYWKPLARVLHANPLSACLPMFRRRPRGSQQLCLFLHTTSWKGCVHRAGVQSVQNILLESSSAAKMHLNPSKEHLKENNRRQHMPPSPLEEGNNTTLGCADSLLWIRELQELHNPRCDVAGRQPLLKLLMHGLQLTHQDHYVQRFCRPP